MNRLPVIDDCETAADVMIRARRVEALRFEMIRPIVAPPPTVAPKVTPPPIPKKEPKPEPPIDLPNFLALPPYEGTVVTWPVVASRPIIRHTAEYFRITVELLLSSHRSQPLVEARWIAMYLLKKLKHFSYPEIGRRMGDRDHTTVLHGVRRVAALVCAEDEKFTEAITEIERRLGV